MCFLISQRSSRSTEPGGHLAEPTARIVSCCFSRTKQIHVGEIAAALLVEQIGSDGPVRHAKPAYEPLPVDETGGSKGKEAPDAARRGSARGAPSLRGDVVMRWACRDALPAARSRGSGTRRTNHIAAFSV